MCFKKLKNYLKKRSCRDKAGPGDNGPDINEDENGNTKIKIDRKNTIKRQVNCE